MARKCFNFLLTARVDLDASLVLGATLQWYD